MKYTEEELELLNALEDHSVASVPIDHDALKVMARETLDYLSEKSRLASTSNDLIWTSSSKE